jgi:hypothetical protein
VRTDSSRCSPSSASRRHAEHGVAQALGRRLAHPLDRRGDAAAPLPEAHGAGQLAEELLALPAGAPGPLVVVPPLGLVDDILQLGQPEAIAAHGALVEMFAGFAAVDRVAAAGEGRDVDGATRLREELGQVPPPLESRRRMTRVPAESVQISPSETSVKGAETSMPRVESARVPALPEGKNLRSFGALEASGRSQSSPVRVDDAIPVDPVPTGVGIRRRSSAM